MNAIDETTLLLTIGQNLHTIRNARKETLQSVAASIGISHPVLSKVENGRYKTLHIELLIKLCNFYKVPLQQVLSIEVAHIFQLTQHNNDGSQKLIGQEVATGYELYIKELNNKIEYLKEQNAQLLQLIVKK